MLIKGIVAFDLPSIKDCEDIKIFLDIPDSLLQRRLMKFYQWKGRALTETKQLIMERYNNEFLNIQLRASQADFLIYSIESL